MFVIIIAIWNCVCIPLQITFQPDWLETIGVDILNNFIDFCFVIDIIVCCRTTYYNTDTGDEVFEPKLTALNYIKSTRFVIDVISTIPLDTIGFILTQSKTPELQIFSLLKLVRISRISVIIRRLNVRLETKNLLKLLTLVLFIIIYLHLSGCLWFWLVQVDMVWIPPLDQYDIDAQFYEDDTFVHQYVQTLYHSVIMFVGKDIRPITIYQLMFVGLCLLVGSLLNANMFGNIALIITEIKMKSNQA